MGHVRNADGAHQNSTGPASHDASTPPLSEMLFQSILEAHRDNPHLPTIHAREGAKFDRLVRHYGPAESVAAFLSERSPYPILPLLHPHDVRTAFTAVLGSIRIPKPRPSDPASGKLGAGGHSLESGIKYFTFCQYDQNLFIACVMLSLSIQQYFFDLATKTTDLETRETIVRIGEQFNARNLVAALPIAICDRHLTEQTVDADSCRRHPAISISADTIRAALRDLHEDGNFQVPGRRRDVPAGSTNEIASLRCPVQAYLSELLVKHNGLKPIFDGIANLEQAMTHPHQNTHVSSLWPAIEAHQNNSELVKAGAAWAQSALVARVAQVQSS